MEGFGEVGLGGFRIGLVRACRRHNRFGMDQSGAVRFVTQRSGVDWFKKGLSKISALFFIFNQNF